MTEKRTPRWRRWTVVLLMIAVIIELLWLVGVNAFLARESTQKLFSEIRPERVKMSWQKAQSWYPGHVRVTGAIVSGQSPRIQWQANVPQAEGNVAILPLLQRKVVIRNLVIPGGEYLQRSRLKPDGSNQVVSQWFPSIRGYDLTEVGERPNTKKKPWTTVFEEAEISGSFNTWIHRFQAEVDATARVNVTVKSQGGPLELKATQLDAKVHRFWADDNETIFDDGSIKGTLSMGPYRYWDHRGGKALRFLSTDVNIEFNSKDMSFVQLFLLKYPSLNVLGNGQVNGHLQIEKGMVADGTDLKIIAEDLQVSQPPFKISGKGNVNLAGGQNREYPFLIGMEYEDLEVYLWEDNAPLITGKRLLIDLYDDGDIVLPRLQETPAPLDFLAEVDVPNAGIDDVTKFNRFLPLDSPMLFTGGQTDFKAKLSFTPQNIDGHYSFSGQQLTALVDQQLVGLDLNFDGVVKGDQPLDAKFNLDGSRLELTNAQVIGQETNFDEQNWSARADITKGTLSFLEAPDLAVSTDLTISDSRPLSALFINNGGPKWIGRRLDVYNLQGKAQLRMSDRDLYVPEANLAGEDLEFAVKGVLASPDIHGMAYFRYKRLDAGLKYENGEKDFVLIGPIKKFDEYSISVPPPPK